MDVSVTTAESYPQLMLESQLCFPLYAAARRVVNYYTPYLKPLGLTYTQYIAMMVMWEHKAISVKEMGTRLFLEPHILPLCPTLGTL